MNDQLLWQQGVLQIANRIKRLTGDQQISMKAILSDYRSSKEIIAAVSQGFGSETICRECAGRCCMNGKYRINVFDAVSIIETGISFLPDFTRKPLCPYSTSEGCAVSPRLRPADCIQFICDKIELQLPEEAKSTLAAAEMKLKQQLQEASRLLSIPASTPLLLWAEQAVSLPFQPKEAQRCL